MTTSRSKKQNTVLFFSGLGVALPALILYWLTSYPTVAYIDSGELAVVGWTLGVAHPSGYPLYTLMARLFSFLPLELIKTQILLGMLSTAASATIITLVIGGFRLWNMGPTESGQTPRLSAPDLSGTALKVALGLLLVVSPLIWSQGITNEVYSLHLVFLALILLLILQPYSHRNLILGGFFVGLSFGNHMSTILLIPSIAAYMIVNRAHLLRAPKMLGYAVLAGIFGASTYFYLPIRASLDPTLNWGHPSNWENFVRHISGWQYRVWMFTRSFAELGQQLAKFAQILFSQFLLPFWLLIGAGIVIGVRKLRAESIYLLLLLLFNLIYSLNFSIPDIDNYLLPSVIVLFLFGAIGTIWLAKLKPALRYLVAGCIFICAVWGVAANWSTHHESDNYSALDGVHNYYRSVEPGALILSADWDFVSPWLYSHFYLKERPDVTLLDPELLRRSWYPDFVRHADPALFAAIKPQVDAFLPNVRKFERQELYDGRTLEAAYRTMLFTLATRTDRPVYLSMNDAGISKQLMDSQRWALEPSGQLWRVLRKGETSARPPEQAILPRFGKPENKLDEREKIHFKFFHTMRQIDSSYAAQGGSVNQ